jgi:hypothetical protein
MPIYLRTRTRRTDYSFLGKAPAHSWWSEFGRLTAFERLSVIVLRLPEGRLQGCFSGIESPARLDRVSTIIRYTLVVEDDEESILALTQAYLLEPEGSGFPELGRVLDGCFKSDDEIEDLMVDDPKVAQAVSQRVKNSLSKYGAVSAQARADRGASHWIAPADLQTGRDAFMGRVQSLVRKQRHGLAARLNLIRTEGEGRALAERWKSMALLLNPDNKLDLNDIEDLTGLQLSGAATPQLPTVVPHPAPSSFSVRIVAAVAVLGLLLLLAWFALGRNVTTPEAAGVPAPASLR